MTWFRGRVCYGYRCPFWVRSGRPASLLIGVIETGKRPEVGYLFARGLDGALLRRPSRPRSSVLVFTADFDISPESGIGDIWTLETYTFPVRRPELLQVLPHHPFDPLRPFTLNHMLLSRWPSRRVEASRPERGKFAIAENAGKACLNPEFAIGSKHDNASRGEIADRTIRLIAPAAIADSNSKFR